ncbi:hypothetical protein PLEOSDRAFT_164065 [Pleurotus ostreatus PC15]|uniref:Uncharacterized protein n=1 Tax=Pleurotus ostreatus (strain PC15) TaxID=1137138 RepID=A0A067PDM9_PLEO1|nr:hypothetical protein PLEOSDRAFT_164065 [Pleurotus ostreatus PC15]
MIRKIQKWKRKGENMCWNQLTVDMFHPHYQFITCIWTGQRALGQSTRVDINDHARTGFCDSAPHLPDASQLKNYSPALGPPSAYQQPKKPHTKAEGVEQNTEDHISSASRPTNESGSTDGRQAIVLTVVAKRDPAGDRENGTSGTAEIRRPSTIRRRNLAAGDCSLAHLSTAYAAPSLPVAGESKTSSKYVLSLWVRAIKPRTSFLHGASPGQHIGGRVFTSFLLLAERGEESDLNKSAAHHLYTDLGLLVLVHAERGDSVKGTVELAKASAYFRWPLRGHLTFTLTQDLNTLQTINAPTKTSTVITRAFLASRSKWQEPSNSITIPTLHGIARLRAQALLSDAQLHGNHRASSMDSNMNIENGGRIGRWCPNRNADQSHSSLAAPNICQLPPMPYLSGYYIDQRMRYTLWWRHGFFVASAKMENVAQDIKSNETDITNGVRTSMGATHVKSVIGNSQATAGKGRWTFPLGVSFAICLLALKTCERRGYNAIGCRL